jgi:hypothetical protein
MLLLVSLVHLLHFLPVLIEVDVHKNQHGEDHMQHQQLSPNSMAFNWDWFDDFGGMFGPLDFSPVMDSGV